MTRATQTPTAEAEAPEAEPTAGTRPPATPAAFPAPAEPQPLAKAPAPGAQPPADAPIPAQATPEPPTPLKRLIPACLTTLSAALWKATALELAILAGHLLLYPTGITQERATPAPTRTSLSLASATSSPSGV
ncbi:hypothetical protein a10_07741 [Streptomyces acidiscabies]|nr:hypothetical protein a10_07741 [Streptomyces acidiscabies]